EDGRLLSAPTRIHLIDPGVRELSPRAELDIVKYAYRCITWEILRTKSIHIPSTFDVTDPVRKDQRLPAEFDPSRDLLGRPSAYKLLEHPEIVTTFLETRFGFSEEEQPWPIGRLQRIYQARFNEEETYSLENH
ncbi:MAG: hypothetical protein ABI324_07130, partial [Ktedonobacteraceae bacterium]